MLQRALLYRWLSLSVFLCCINPSLAAEGRVSLNLNVSFGSHTTQAKLGLLAFVATGDTKIAAEAGLGLWTQANIKRFGQSHVNWSGGYEAFTLLGLGNNANLLGSTLSKLEQQAVFVDRRSPFFVGAGFGISDEWNSGRLNDIIHRNGKVYVRVADQHNSLYLGFANDLKESVFLGEGRDYGNTASGEVGFATASRSSLSQVKVGFVFITPKPDFAKAPNNPVNSSDGRKRVWFTEAPLDDLFNGHFYLSATHINRSNAYQVVLGVDSPRLAARLQNDIHDDFGLMPRFPWPVHEKNKLLWNVAISERIGSDFE